MVGEDQKVVGRVHRFDEPETEGERDGAFPSIVQEDDLEELHTVLADDGEPSRVAPIGQGSVGGDLGPFELSRQVRQRSFVRNLEGEEVGVKGLPREPSGETVVELPAPWDALSEPRGFRPGRIVTPGRGRKGHR